MTLGHQSPWALAALAWLALLGMPLAVIDVRSRRLPDWLTLPAFAGVILLLGAGAVAGHQLGHFGQAIGGAAALAGFYLALMVIRPGGMFLGGQRRGGAGVGELAGAAGGHLRGLRARRRLRPAPHRAGPDDPQG